MTLQGAIGKIIKLVEEHQEHCTRIVRQRHKSPAEEIDCARVVLERRIHDILTSPLVRYCDE